MDREALVQLIVERVVAALRAQGAGVCRSASAPAHGGETSGPVASDASPAASPRAPAVPPGAPADDCTTAAPGKFAFLDSPLPAVIALFCGPASESLDAVLAPLQRIREHANLHLIFSHTFCRTADTDAIERALTPALVCREVNPVRLRAVLPRYKALVVPAMSINTLAKLCAGITDSTPTAALFEALARGLPVLICRESVDPEHLQMSSALGRSTPASLRNALYHYMSRLEQWGAQWTELGALAAAVEAMLVPAREALKLRRTGAAAGGRLILLREDIEDMMREGRLRLTLPPGAIVTDAARELAAERGFRLEESGTPF
ncbi:MAG: hypothetical protein Kow0059_20740 [Candidatus Sumerlaeia bacterium]